MNFMNLIHDIYVRNTNIYSYKTCKKLVRNILCSVSRFTVMDFIDIVLYPSRISRTDFDTLAQNKHQLHQSPVSKPIPVPQLRLVYCDYVLS